MRPQNKVSERERRERETELKYVKEAFQSAKRGSPTPSMGYL
jgi:hypothetical protein